jgi:hypothetical protein
VIVFYVRPRVFGCEYANSVKVKFLYLNDNDNTKPGRIDWNGGQSLLNDWLRIMNSHMMPSSVSYSVYQLISSPKVLSFVNQAA